MKIMRDVGEPHGEGEQDLGVAEVGGAVRDLREHGADEQAGGHAGQAEEQGLGRSGRWFRAAAA